MKFKLLIVSLFILCSIGVYAFDMQLSYNWLTDTSNQGNHNNNIIDTSAAALALRAAGSSYGNAERSYILSQANTDGCFPASSCTVKDTAFAILALDELGEDTSLYRKWMINAQKGVMLRGKWDMQVTTTSTGTCKVSYYKGANNVSKVVKVENGVFPNCNQNTWFDLNSCLEPGLLINYPNMVINVDCSDLDDVVISLTYVSGTDYYLMQDIHNRVGDLYINNGCYGKTYKSICDYSSSLYAGWALEKINSDTNVDLYLRENANKVNNEHNSILYIITGDSIYASELVDRQRTDGSWDGDVYKTALAVIALRSSTDYSDNAVKAIEWLNSKQGSDGSYGNTLNTGMVLYAVNIGGSVILPGCNDGKQNQGEEGVDCGGPCLKDCSTVCNHDDSCDSPEDCYNCPDDCPECEGETDKTGKSDCIEDGDCELPYENRKNCPADCSCGDSICDSDEKLSGDCKVDCPVQEDTTGEPDTTESGFPWGTLMLILLIGIFGFGLYYYSKTKKGKGGSDKPKGKGGGFFAELFGSKKKTEKVDYTNFPAKLQGQGINPTYGRFAGKGLFNKRDSVESELDKSIREANKLFKGK